MIEPRSIRLDGAPYLVAGGLPAGFDLEAADGLGLQIVRTLLASELDSELALRPRTTGGTEAVMRLSLRGR